MAADTVTVWALADELGMPVEDVRVLARQTADVEWDHYYDGGTMNAACAAAVRDAARMYRRYLRAYCRHCGAILEPESDEDGQTVWFDQWDGWQCVPAPGWTGPVPAHTPGGTAA